MRTNCTVSGLVFATCLLVQIAGAQSNATLILKGSDYAFSILLPSGWSLDTAAAEQFSAKAVLHWREQGRLVGEITIFIATKKIEGKSTLPNLLSFGAHTDSLFGIKAAGPPQTLWTKDKKKAILLTSITKTIPTYIAYVEDANIVAVFSTGRREQNFLEKVLSSLKEVVESYSSISAPNGAK